MCLVHGVFDAAMKYFCLALQFAQCIDDISRDEYVADCYSNLAEAYRCLDDLELAKEYLECALSSYLKTFDPTHLDVAKCYGNLATVHHDLSDLEQAKEYLERALVIHLKKLGPNDLDVSMC